MIKKFHDGLLAEELPGLNGTSAITIKTVYLQGVLFYIVGNIASESGGFKIPLDI